MTPRSTTYSGVESTTHDPHANEVPDNAPGILGVGIKRILRRNRLTALGVSRTHQRKLPVTGIQNANSSGGLPMPHGQVPSRNTRRRLGWPAERRADTSLIKKGQHLGRNAQPRSNGAVREGARCRQAPTFPREALPPFHRLGGSLSESTKHAVNIARRPSAAYWACS